MCPIELFITKNTVGIIEEHKTFAVRHFTVYENGIYLQ
jgi:hypothetical protein